MENGIERIGLAQFGIDELGQRAAALVRDVQFSLSRAMTDIVSLGEVLTEVKSRTEFGRYGSYGKFLAENGLEERMAQYSVAAYKRYAQKPDLLAKLGSVSKLKELLALPEAMEEEFLQTHDIETMSVRELKAQVKEAKAPHLPENGKTSDAPEQKKELERLKAELKKVQEMQKQAQEQIESERQRVLEAEKRQNSLRQMLEKNREMRGQLEEENARLRQAALHEGEKKETSGDGRISGADFGKNVKKFLTENCEVPQMAHTFDEMTVEERTAFSRGLDTLESFIKNARTALCGLGEATVK